MVNLNKIQLIIVKSRHFSFYGNPELRRNN